MEKFILFFHTPSEIFTYITQSLFPPAARLWGQARIDPGTVITITQYFLRVRIRVGSERLGTA
jgi:hypothetical protein